MKTKQSSVLNWFPVLMMVITMTCSCEKGECLTIDCSIAEPVTSGSIIDVIKFYQDKYVRKSYTEWDCFTNADYSVFQSFKVLDKIKAELLSSKTLGNILAEVAKLNETERNQLFKTGLATYQPTWAELGAITAKGQTTAGQTAQKEIASTIVTLVKEKGGYKN